MFYFGSGSPPIRPVARANFCWTAAAWQRPAMMEIFGTNGDAAPLILKNLSPALASPAAKDSRLGWFDANRIAVSFS
jgi:hypothetical protein